MSTKPMPRARVDGAELEFEVTGAGEPVLLIHGAFIAEAYAPLCAEPALNSRYRLVRYHRRGYAGSSPVRAPFSLGQQAADCRALLEHLGIERAHVVGHSSGGVIALRLALDAPEVVHSLILLEPGAARRPKRSLARRSARAGAGAVRCRRQGGRGRQLPSLGDRARLPRLARSADPGRVPAVRRRRRHLLRRRASVDAGVAFYAGGRPGGSPSLSSACLAPRAPRFGPAGTRFKSGCVSGCRRPSRSCSRARTTR